MKTTYIKTQYNIFFLQIISHNRVIHHHAVQMPFVIKEMEQVHAHAWKDIKATHTRAAALNVYLVRIALQTNLVLKTSVQIHAQEYVARMQNVPL